VTTPPHHLDRTLVVEAPQATVFRYFTDSARWAAWWGEGSTIDARPGGRVFIRYPNGIEAAGEVVEIEAPSRIVFTFGYLNGKPFPPGASLVTIRLESAPRGTRLVLLHQFAEAAARDEHVQGWRYQLSVFANVVADEVHRDAASLVDAWFAVWSEKDDGARRTRLASIATDGVRLRDRFSFIDGARELAEHIGASQRFMPGLRIARDSEARHCQGTVIADWVATSTDGQPRARGTNVFVLDANAKIEAVTGFWKSPEVATAETAL
jgi:uncharacterized protein YndB with AHSA1/START domain